MTSFLTQILDELTTHAQAGRACSRVDVSRAGIVLIAAEVFIVPIRHGVRGLIPGIPVDFFVDPSLADLEVRLARPTGQDLHAQLMRA